MNHASIRQALILSFGYEPFRAREAVLLGVLGDHKSSHRGIVEAGIWLSANRDQLGIVPTRSGPSRNKAWKVDEAGPPPAPIDPLESRLTAIESRLSALESKP